MIFILEFIPVVFQNIWDAGDTELLVIETRKCRPKVGDVLRLQERDPKATIKLGGRQVDVHVTKQLDNDKIQCVKVLPPVDRMVEFICLNCMAYYEKQKDGRWECPICKKVRRI
jgi:hypothetical protein